MSNKAISMCLDQGPRVLTQVISPGSPACATSSSETDPPLLSILPPLSNCKILSARVTILHPQETQGRNAREQEKEEGPALRSEIADEKAVCPAIAAASKGNFTKADPLLMNVI